MKMKQAELITNKSGRCLVCWYFGTQYNEAIAEAERLHGVEGDASVTVIALPAGWGRGGNFSKRRQTIERPLVSL